MWGVLVVDVERSIVGRSKVIRVDARGSQLHGHSGRDLGAENETES